MGIIRKGINSLTSAPGRTLDRVRYGNTAKTRATIPQLPPHKLDFFGMRWRASNRAENQELRNESLRKARLIHPIDLEDWLRMGWNYLMAHGAKLNNNVNSSWRMRI